MNSSGRLVDFVDGRPILPDSVHPMPNLLSMSVGEVLEAFKTAQAEDFREVVSGLHEPDNALRAVFQDIAVQAEPDNPFHSCPVFRPAALQAMFEDVHDHVLNHPVWSHPFFVRVFDGDADLEHLRRFAAAYFNQIKNTRQCVALAAGRFNSLMDLPYGRLNERISEITQISLAQLIADEYGLGAHDLEDYPELGALFRSRTHIVMYRRLFDGLGMPFEAQDQPLLWGVADNVLIQRLVAGNEIFSPLEALASVGLGMEWGVPEFFSLLLGGMIKTDQRLKLGLTANDLEVFIAHVRYDVLHAVSVMVVTSLHMRNDRDADLVKNACNMLMAGRYAMMCDLYRHVFNEKCPSLAEIGLDRRYYLQDRRIEQALVRARQTIAPKNVVRGDEYRARTDVELVFA